MRRAFPVPPEHLEIIQLMASERTYELFVDHGVSPDHPAMVEFAARIVPQREAYNAALFEDIRRENRRINERLKEDQRRRNEKSQAEEG